MPQFLDLAFEFGERPFEIEEMAHLLVCRIRNLHEAHASAANDHLRRASGCAVSTRRRSRSP